MGIQQLKEYVDTLQTQFSSPPTFEQFKADWENWDERSKRIILVGVNNPGDDEHLVTIRKYLIRMGELFE